MEEDEKEGAGNNRADKGDIVTFCCEVFLQTTKSVSQPVNVRALSPFCRLLDHFSAHVLAPDLSCNVTLHRGLTALRTFAATALASPGPAPRILELLERCLHLARNKYRLVRTALLDLFASLDFTQVRKTKKAAVFFQNFLLWALHSPAKFRVLLCTICNRFQVA